MHRLMRGQPTVLRSPFRSATPKVSPSKATRRAECRPRNGRQEMVLFGIRGDRGIRPAVTDEQGKTALFLKDIHRDKMALVAQHAKHCGWIQNRLQERADGRGKRIAADRNRPSRRMPRPGPQSQARAWRNSAKSWAGRMPRSRSHGCHLFQCDSQSGEYRVLSAQRKLSPEDLRVENPLQAQGLHGARTDKRSSHWKRSISCPRN